MKITVLGCGRWGSFIAWYLNGRGNEVISFGPDDAESFRVLKETGKNEYVTFPETIALCSDLAAAVTNRDAVVCSISSQALRSFLSREELSEYKKSKKPLILCMKGVEEGSGKRLSEVAVECGFDAQSVAVWVGPGHIQDFTAGIPNCMVIDSANEALARTLCDTFRSSLIRFYYGCDLVGSELGAATKNVMGIAAGMLDGFGLCTLKGPLMARGAREVARLISACGGNELSAYGLCHLGDYETTLFSKHSHNRAYGEGYVKGEKFAKLAEGVSTTKAVLSLAKEKGVEMPITEAVSRILFDGEDAKSVLLSLFERQSKTEF